MYTTALDICLIAACLQPAAEPIVIWASTPLGPGQTIMLFGHRFADDCQVKARQLSDGEPGRPHGEREVSLDEGTRLEIRGRSREDCLMVGVPADFTPGVYQVVVTSGGAKSSPIYINRPRLSWWLGDQPEAVSPGGELRLFGAEFVLTKPGEVLPRAGVSPPAYKGGVLLIDAKKGEHPLQVLRADKYALTVSLPLAVATGEARVFVHNGHGGADGWSEGLPVNVQPLSAWPATEFNVREFGAVGDGVADDTTAFRSALTRARMDGGGVVVVPRGTYKLTGQLSVPPRTVLRGRGPDATWLYVPQGVPELNTVFAGQRDFAIEGLWLSAQTSRRLIIAPDHKRMYNMPWGSPPPKWTGWARNVRLRDLRLHHLRYAHRVTTADRDPRRLETTGPSTVEICGDAVDVQRCTIVSSGMPLVVMNTSRSRICDNVLHIGRAGWYRIWTCQQTCFEGNQIVGRDLEASYGGFNGDMVERIYIADNTFHGGFGCEREALTFDTPGRYPWLGVIRSATANEVTIDPPKAGKWERHSLVGLGCYVIRGRGLGQARQIIDNSETTVKLDRPWQVVPDSASVLTIRPYLSDVTVYRNTSEDTSVGVQLWGGGFRFTIDGNTSVRTGGLWGSAAHYLDGDSQIFLPCFFTQWLNNTVKEGFIFEQGPYLHARLGLINRQTSSGPEPHTTPILANVIRNNTVSDQTTVGLFYFGEPAVQAVEANGLKQVRSPFAEAPGRATLIEGNTVSNSPVGIEVAPFFEDTLVRDNRFHDVARPVNDRNAAIVRKLTDLKARGPFSRPSTATERQKP
jgi:hypothetical protein